MLNTGSRAGVAQLARASAFQAEGRGFEARLPLQLFQQQYMVSSKASNFRRDKTPLSLTLRVSL